MNDVLKALERNEEVEILYHRKKIGVISPVKNASPKRVQAHPFFGMNDCVSVNKTMEQLPPVSATVRQNLGKLKFIGAVRKLVLCQQVLKIKMI
jgi:hypothetical protein